jgi:hypothetical protein
MFSLPGPHRLAGTGSAHHLRPLQPQDVMICRIEIVSRELRI